MTSLPLDDCTIIVVPDLSLSRKRKEVMWGSNVKRDERCYLYIVMILIFFRKLYFKLFIQINTPYGTKNWRFLCWFPSGSFIFSSIEVRGVRLTFPYVVTHTCSHVQMCQCEGWARCFLTLTERGRTFERSIVFLYPPVRCETSYATILHPWSVLWNLC